MSQNLPPRQSRFGLDTIGLHNVGAVYWNLTPSALYEAAIERGEAEVVAGGPLVAETGIHTGRSPNDKFTVEEPESKESVWWGPVNKPISEAHFERLYAKIQSYVQGRELFVQDCYGGADPEHRLNVRIVSEYAWHNLFCRNMFITPADSELQDFEPGFTVVNCPDLEAVPETDGTNSATFVVCSFKHRLVLIGGTSYAGENKKSIFGVLNYILPERGVLPMHCSANIGEKGDTALFFGLSGTGKTTLSADPSRGLIGDDEHGWSDNGTFNFEGGCYAKVINLSEEAEPQIYATTKRFGTVLENVVYDPDTREIDLDDGSLTENTRASYPIEFIEGFVPSGTGGHPQNVFFLTCDAFGVLPPVSKLSPEQAMYHFLSGYTAKVAGTEKGITEPQATFSACFGSPFLPRHPGVYAKMLGEKIAEHGANVWLINTGWTGGGYGTGSRMKIKHTRATLAAALSGALDDVAYETDPIFGLSIPVTCPDVPDEVLRPNETWSDQAAYEAQAKKLADLFRENFKNYEDGVDDAVKAAGPR
ncbi:MAG: phosphoenolpyruvate carboxykinase [Planctomycetota bacterium]|jgi:phosphoenolpyruvate carboxykinase (ATP)